MSSVTDASRLVRKLWEFCNILRDDGLSYPDYVEQLTYLLFLKMSDEQRIASVPREFAWPTFLRRDARALQVHYAKALGALGAERGVLGMIFRDARNKIRDPEKLRLLVVDLIGSLDWSSLSADVQGDAYEGLLEKNARDTKSGAGQYFTPRPLIDAIVRCVDPRLGEVISDPACGTGGFLLAAKRHLTLGPKRLQPRQEKHLAMRALRGGELVPEVARLATMNLLLHGIGGDTDDTLPVTCADSLTASPSTKVDVVLTNPPFGVKGSVSFGPRASGVGNGDSNLVAHRADFWVETSNKQLNFIQHVVSQLKPGGRAAMVLPDNVLFEGGAAVSIRRHLMDVCDLHTLLRLPAGIFYAQSVNANVIFFDRRARPHSGQDVRSLRVFDLRSGQRYSKTRPLSDADLEDFVEGYRAQRPAQTDDARWSTVPLADIAASAESAWDFPVPADDLHATYDSTPALIDELSRSISEDLLKAAAHISRVGTRATSPETSR